MNKPDIEPLHTDFGARILGITLSGKMADNVLNFIRQSIEQYSLLCFPDQDMSDEKQLAFTRLLGTPETEHVRFGRTGEVSYLAQWVISRMMAPKLIPPMPATRAVTSYGIQIPLFAKPRPLSRSCMPMRYPAKVVRPNLPVCVLGMRGYPTRCGSG